jgi:hypothetical protein
LRTSDQATDRVTDKVAVYVQRKRLGFFSLMKAMKRATEQPPNRQHLVRESDIVTDRAGDNAALSPEK